VALKKHIVNARYVLELQKKGEIQICFEKAEGFFSEKKSMTYSNFLHQIDESTFCHLRKKKIHFLG